MSGRSFSSEGKRPAFTLVELLVVIAIIGILVALLLPAVQAAREAARRLQCSNKLKQIALAVLHYESQYRVFPVCIPQTKHDPYDDPNMNPNGVGWMVRILPFLEHQVLYETMNFDGPARTGTGILNHQNRSLIATLLPVYLCPSDSEQPIRDDVWYHPERWGIPMASMNYAGVVGPHVVISYGRFPGLLPYCNNLGASVSLGVLECTGCFWRHSYILPVTMASFEDGTSKTLMVGEVVPEYTTYAARKHTFRAWALSNGSLAFTSMPINHVDPELMPDSVGFHSRHAGGAHFAWADGQVSFVEELIDLDVYWGLSTRFGGETVSPP